MGNILGLISDFIDTPEKFLNAFIKLVVPSTCAIGILVAGQYAKESGYGIIGNLILFVLDIWGKITMWIFTTFIDCVIYLVVIAVIIGALLKVFKSIPGF